VDDPGYHRSNAPPKRLLIEVYDGLVRRIALLRMLNWFTCAVVCLTGFDALADDVRFKVINGTSFPIRVLTLSQADIGAWGPNVLAAPSIGPGDAREVSVRGTIVDCNVDLKVGFDGSDSQPVWKYLNLCNLRQIRLNFDQMTGMTTASYEE
jgi:hypothetical protein